MIENPQFCVVPVCMLYTTLLGEPCFLQKCGVIKELKVGKDVVPELTARLRGNQNVG